MAKYNWLSEWKRLLIVNQKLQYYISDMLLSHLFLLPCRFSRPDEAVPGRPRGGVAVPRGLPGQRQRHRGGGRMGRQM